MTRGRRPSESFPELVYDEEEKTNPDPPGRRRTATPARALEALPGYAPGYEIGKRDGRREGVIQACDRFVTWLLANPKNDVGVAYLLAGEVARALGVELPPRLPGAPRPQGAGPPPPPAGGPRRG